MKEHQRAVVEFLGGLKKGRLLDAGSGGDEVGNALALKGFDVVSLDLYSTPSHKGRFIRADMNAVLPFRKGSFDYVLCSEALQYLENHTLLFREFGRVLRAGGSLIISLPNLLNASSRLYFLKRGFFPHFKPLREMDMAKAWDSVAYNTISLVEIMELAKRSDFELRGIRASRIRSGALPMYLLLKALYSIGLLFERCQAKASLIRRLSSREALLGDHLVLELSLKDVPGGGRG